MGKLKPTPNKDITEPNAFYFSTKSQAFIKFGPTCLNMVLVPAPGDPRIRSFCTLFWSK
jgi:hypothetical protein